MKRELKVVMPRVFQAVSAIARPIPMKRELKAVTISAYRVNGLADRKAHPDEKGTERGSTSSIDRPIDSNRKAHPDEKGTERTPHALLLEEPGKIARPIPMKRELKGVYRSRAGAVCGDIARPIPMKRELKG